MDGLKSLIRGFLRGFLFALLWPWAALAFWVLGMAAAARGGYGRQL